MSAPESAVGRSDVSAALEDVRQRVADPVFVGPAATPEAVLVSPGRYRSLERAQRRAAVGEAIGSARAEGVEFGPVGMSALARVASGVIDEDDAVAEVIAHYRHR